MKLLEFFGREPKDLLNSFVFYWPAIVFLTWLHVFEPMAFGFGFVCLFLFLASTHGSFSKMFFGIGWTTLVYTWSLNCLWIAFTAVGLLVVRGLGLMPGLAPPALSACVILGMVLYLLGQYVLYRVSS